MHLNTAVAATDYNVFTTNNQNSGEEAAEMMHWRLMCQVLNSQDIKLKPNLIKEMEAA
jgi:hypothetical protein